MRRYFRSLLVFAVLAALAGPAAARSGRSTDSATKPQIKITADPFKNPMVFYLAKGETDACGPGCSEWIAADGAIDIGAASQLRKLLGRLGGRKPPIFFHSPGGLVEGAIAMGRLIRERRMTAGIGWTIPQGCDAQRPNEESCKKLKRLEQALPSQLDILRTMCSSACVYAFVGAAVRNVAPDARLGIHSSSFFFRDHRGRAVSTSAVSHKTRAAAVQRSHGRLSRYLHDMGIDTALLKVAAEIPHDKIRVLTRSEIVKFNIDPREFLESDWHFLDKASVNLIKIFVSAVDNTRNDFQTNVVRLNCRSRNQLQLIYAQQLAADNVNSSHTVRISSHDRAYTMTKRTRTRLQNFNAEFDVYVADVPVSFFLVAAKNDIIGLTEEMDASSAEKMPRMIKLSTAGLLAALSSLLQRCGYNPI